MALIVIWIIMTLSTGMWFWKTATEGNQNKFAWAAIGALAVTFPSFLVVVIYSISAIATSGPTGLTGIHAILAVMIMAATASFGGFVASRLLLRRIEKEKELRASYSQKICAGCSAIVESWASICPTCQTERFHWE